MSWSEVLHKCRDSLWNWMFYVRNCHDKHHLWRDPSHAHLLLVLSAAISLHPSPMWCFYFSEKKFMSDAVFFIIGPNIWNEILLWKIILNVSFWLVRLADSELEKIKMTKYLWFELFIGVSTYWLPGLLLPFFPLLSVKLFVSLWYDSL